MYRCQLADNEMRKVLIVAPSLDVEKNVSGISAVVNFIIANNREYDDKWIFCCAQSGTCLSLGQIVVVGLEERDEILWKGCSHASDSLYHKRSA